MKDKNNFYLIFQELKIRQRKIKFDLEERDQITMQIPGDLKPVIEEIITAHKEQRIKAIEYNYPSIWKIITEPEPVSKKIFIQILPKK